MPSARANISAKFMAQIETSNTWAARNSAPAEETRPTIVSSSGSPAATSAPKASTRIASVTGQLMSSERIIASRLAVLKSDHIPDAPVRLTLTWSVDARRSGPFRSSAARHHPHRVRRRSGHDDGRVAVGGDRRALPRRASPTPPVGSARRMASARAIADANAGSAV